ncbi:MAG: penicillin-binding protein 2 [Alphaproteobacteria bacterium]|nr:penicillin-binding protein 2 [Alphaproteobacteria bacterium]
MGLSQPTLAAAAAERQIPQAPAHRGRAGGHRGRPAAEAHAGPGGPGPRRRHSREGRVAGRPAVGPGRRRRGGGRAMRHITTIEFDGAGKRAVDNARGRVRVAMAVFTVCFVAISLRLIDLGLLGAEGSDQRGTPTAQEVAPRADIVDRNGVLLATDLTAVSVYAQIPDVLDPHEAALKLASVLPGVSADRLEQEMTSHSKFIWVKRKVTPAEYDAVNRLGLPGIGFQREIERVYPQGNLAAHLVGYTNVDGKGLAGVERYFDKRLRKEGPHGEPLRLALDVRVQHVLRDEIAKSVEEFSAEGGGGLVLDIHTGELIAMTSLPDFNPNRPGRIASQPELINRMSHAVYEWGSTFKTFTMAMALDEGVTAFNDTYDATHPIHVARFVIHDDHPQARWLSLPEIFMYSSNIGTVKVALDVGTDNQKAFLGKLGFFERPHLQLKETGAPLVPAVWREINTMTIAFGHGLSITGVQLARAYAAVAGDGRIRPVTVLKTEPGYEPKGERIVSPETARKIQGLLRLVVERGTGRNANAPHYLVGGKTGTAEKASVHGYRRKALVSSFASVFPITNPRYVMVVMIDEPHGTKETYGYATAGWTAAPATKRIIERIAPMLGVPPSNETTHPVTKELLQYIQPEVRS